jgi:prolyl-tRNA editing enzyme YbaK/EbsC (Cys-tRNA(Pro) deacylase)
MPQILPSSARRVQEFLLHRGSKAEVQLLPDTTATAQDAAAALDVQLFQIGKSIVFQASDRILVVVLCGDQRVDTNSLAQMNCVVRISALSADEVKIRTGYIIGGVSPFGLPSDVQVIVDSRLHNLSNCYVAAGHPKAVVLTNGEEIIQLTGGVVETIAQSV